MGALKEIGLRLGSRGSSKSAWHVREVEVLKASSGERFLFLLNDWLLQDKEHPEGRVTIPETSTEAGKAARKTVQYKV